MHILIATDGKAHSLKAARFANNLFHGTQSTFTVIHIHPKKGAEETLTQAADYLRAVKKILAKRFKVKTKLVIGDIVDSLLVECQTGGYDLLVMGSRGPSSVLTGVTESILPSKARTIIELANLSLLVVVADASLAVRKVLLCSDGSPFAEKALHFWGNLKESCDYQTIVLNIAPNLFNRFKDEMSEINESLRQVLVNLPGPKREMLKRSQDILKNYGIKAISKLIEKEYAAEEIIKEAAHEYGLVVLGYRGKKYRGDGISKSQSQLVIKNAPTSILVIK